MRSGLEHVVGVCLIGFINSGIEVPARHSGHTMLTANKRLCIQVVLV